MEDRNLNWRKATYSNGGENCIESLPTLTAWWCATPSRPVPGR